jgi:acetyltransferase-like isoleucine patch superfamily enzyme
LRFALLGRAAGQRGDLIDIREDVYLHGVAGLRLGSRVSIHPLTYIDATGGLQIGDDVSIAHGATIMTTTHTWENPGLPIRDNPVVASSVTIGSNVWVGAGARILAGSRIGDACVIGAGAVVTGVIPPNSVAVGVPARVVKPVYPGRKD